MITFSICLSDIPKERITTSEKNGKKYVNLVMFDQQDADKYGNTRAVIIAQSKEEREAKKDKVYVGNGKDWDGKGGKAVTSHKSEPVDDLPF
jgi:hypothetical protein